MGLMDELISKGAAIDALSHMCSEDENGITVSRANANSMLMALPSAEPERKAGQWERHYSRPNVYADLWWHCSVCGYKNDDQYANRYHHYCPNCGCQMREGEDNEQND